MSNPRVIVCVDQLSVVHTYLLVTSLESWLPYLLDQTPLSISSRSRIVGAPPDVLNQKWPLLNTSRGSLFE